MKPFFLVAAFAVIITALVIAWPERLINPGPLMEGHRDLKNSCLSCHKPFGGASLQCISCHKQADIGIRNVAGRVLPKKSGQPIFHSAFSSNSCVECHTDHKGLNPQRAVKNFRHDSLSGNIKNNCNACHKAQTPRDNLHLQVGEGCASCHDTVRWKNATLDHRNLAVSGRQCVSCHRSEVPGDALHREAGESCASCHDTRKWKNVVVDHSKFSVSGKQCLSCHRKVLPDDALHRQAGANCASCHDTRKWKNAVLDHSKLSAAGKQCVSCHRKDLPSDALHRQSKANCSECHQTTRWKPANFDHDRYFRLDGDHRASCVTCHTDPKNYKSYTCYNCHEHSRSRMEVVHREEGIRNLDNCIRCHRSANGEHEGREGGDRREGRGDDD
ncbi:MAG TPA: cytochrome c3 family protein [Chlorobaculum sp.]|nr:cytochrome c3 family protein [Chlorobaculum sp.]